jgi:hypothetical protein
MGNRLTRVGGIGTYTSFGVVGKTRGQVNAGGLAGTAHSNSGLLCVSPMSKGFT